MALQSAKSSLLEPLLNRCANSPVAALDVPRNEAPPQSLRPEPSTGLAKASLVQAYTCSGQTQEKEELSNLATTLAHTARNTRLAKISDEASLEILEVEVKTSLKFLEKLMSCLKAFTTQNQHSQDWIQQIKDLQERVVDTPTIIGVVGNTGAGKSSVINALLDEERLVPTNCMRACTAVVTEISFNTSNDESAKYRAKIEFIKAEDWQSELEILLAEFHESNGTISPECNTVDSPAGVAYAKIKAVYPQKTKDDLKHSTVEELMQDPCVRDVLGTVKTIERARPELFHTVLQRYVDSMAKATAGFLDKAEKREIEFWPLIKVVRIYTKATALSTGTVIVDLPGMHDSNKARATIAEDYLKQCSGLWIASPINRAVDDKAAKSLLGESFKRQLKYDGTYSRVTFICTKTDDISITEVAENHDPGGELFESWARIDQIEKDISTRQESAEGLEKSKFDYGNELKDVKDQLKIWVNWKRRLENGETVVAPSDISKKRKRSAEANGSRKERNYSCRSGSYDSEDGINTNSDDTAEELPNRPGTILTSQIIKDKITELRLKKRSTARICAKLDADIQSQTQEIKSYIKENGKIKAEISARCIKQRNDYSRAAIQVDFAAGIKEMDQEDAAEEDEEQFNPEQDLRDYDKVARSLPVFCVSSRAFQKLSGRLQREPDVPGFQSLEETEIPRLQAYCKKLTEAGRRTACRRSLNSLTELMISMSLWIRGDGKEKPMEGEFLRSRLQDLDEELGKAVQDCCREAEQILAKHIFTKYSYVIQLAADEAPLNVAKWGAPVNKQNRAAGGYPWPTYKALCRRGGVLSNAQGAHNMNLQLVEPIVKQLANPWESVFSERLPQAFKRFAKRTEMTLQSFHQGIISQAIQSGAGVTAVAMLGQQVRSYQAVFGDVVDDILRDINAHQREANRAFAPVIAKTLASAYEKCAAEHGRGLYQRMKTHMTTHVEICRSTMFAESCEEVKDLLTQMCRGVEKSMSEKTRRVFEKIRQKYLVALSGERLQEYLMPPLNRNMRTEIAELIQARKDGTDVDEEAAETATIGSLA